MADSVERDATQEHVADWPSENVQLSSSSPYNSPETNTEYQARITATNNVPFSEDAELAVIQNWVSDLLTEALSILLNERIVTTSSCGNETSRSPSVYEPIPTEHQPVPTYPISSSDPTSLLPHSEKQQKPVISERNLECACHEFETLQKNMVTQDSPEEASSFPVVVSAEVKDVQILPKDAEQMKTVQKDENNSHLTEPSPETEERKGDPKISAEPASTNFLTFSSLETKAFDNQKHSEEEANKIIDVLVDDESKRVQTHSEKATSSELQPFCEPVSEEDILATKALEIQEHSQEEANELIDMLVDDESKQSQTEKEISSEPVSEEDIVTTKSSNGSEKDALIQQDDESDLTIHNVQPTGGSEELLLQENIKETINEFVKTDQLIDEKILPDRQLGAEDDLEPNLLDPSTTSNDVHYIQGPTTESISFESDDAQTVEEESKLMADSVTKSAVMTEERLTNEDLHTDAEKEASRDEIADHDFDGQVIQHSLSLMESLDNLNDRPLEISVQSVDDMIISGESPETLQEGNDLVKDTQTPTEDGMSSSTEKIATEGAPDQSIHSSEQDFAEHPEYNDLTRQSPHRCSTMPLLPNESPVERTQPILIASRSGDYTIDDMLSSAPMSASLTDSDTVQWRSKDFHRQASPDVDPLRLPPSSSPETGFPALQPSISAENLSTTVSHTKVSAVLPPVPNFSQRCPPATKKRTGGIDVKQIFSFLTRPISNIGISSPSTSSTSPGRDRISECLALPPLCADHSSGHLSATTPCSHSTCVMNATHIAYSETKTPIGEYSPPTSANDTTIRRIPSKKDNLLPGLKFFRQSRKADVEQIQRWRKSFDCLLSDSSGLELFHNYLKTEYSQENIQFWIACEEYKNISSTKKMNKEAQRIYQNFLSIQAPQEVNLDSKTRIQTIAAVSNPNKRTFENAQKKIHALMEKDSYPRFLRSDFYQNALRDASSHDND